MKTIIHSVHIRSAPQEVSRALTTKAGLTAWWTTEATVEPGEGGVVRFTFRGDFHPHMRHGVGPGGSFPPRRPRWSGCAAYLDSLTHRDSASFSITVCGRPWRTTDCLRLGLNDNQAGTVAAVRGELKCPYPR